MITNIYRFHGHGGLRYVYKNGQAIRSRLMTLKFSPNPRRKYSRHAVVVSKKVHKSAVGRNRIRRRLYELVRTRIPEENGVYDIVLIVSSADIIHMPADELKACVDQLFEQSCIYETL